jgi:tetratricopeptide (TPR) repeat protein
MIFFPAGDKKKGMAQLREASEKAMYAKTEATYFLVQLLQNYEKDPLEGLTLALKLYKQFPGNPLFHRYVGRCQTSIAHWEEMHQTFLDILQRVKEHRMGYSASAEREAHYYLGLYGMNGKNFDEALQHFYRCDELSRVLDKDGPSGFMVMTNLKMGNIYDLQSKRDVALQQYNKVLQMTDYLDSHKEAEKYLKNPFSKF